MRAGSTAPDCRAGRPWPWWPRTLSALTIPAAIGVALLSAATARAYRP